MDRLPPIGNAYLKKFTSLNNTIMLRLYGQLINGTIYLRKSECSTVFRLTTFEQFDDFCKPCTQLMAAKSSTGESNQ